MKKLLYLIGLITLASCDPFVSVYLRNHTESDLNIKVKITDDYLKGSLPKFSISDSLLADDCLKLHKIDNYFNESNVYYNPDSTWFYFTLGKGNTAFLSHTGFIYPSVQNFTLSSPIGFETIEIPRKSRIKKEKVSDIYNITGDTKNFGCSIIFDIK